MCTKVFNDRINIVDLEINKVAVLRAVENNPISEPSKGPGTGILFTCVKKAECLHCKAAVPLQDEIPLSWVQCPECKGKVLVPGLVDGFLLHERIGEGEMGTIYRATDESLHREVAIKVVRGCHIDDPKSRERLQREACSAGSLNHPRVAQVYALNFSNRHPYLVMELVTGMDFYKKLEAEGYIDEPTVLRMALDVADGLSALNREHLSHGDIKPGNIVLDRDGNAKLVDFGLSGITRFEDGALVGTPNYIAPELLRGSVDTHRSDIYSFGATLYHLLSGKIPFEGETSVDILKARLSQNPVPLGTYAPHVSELTQSLVMSMIEFNPWKRPVSTDSVASEIKKALAQLEEVTAIKLETLEDVQDFIKPRHVDSMQPTVIHSRRPAIVLCILCLIALVELFVAIKEQSFAYTWEWLRHDVGGSIKAMALAVTHNKLEPVEPDMTSGAYLHWQSTNLGGRIQRGSTMRSGDVMVIQATGAGMWQGRDDCRFVWTQASSNYVFSSRIQEIADEKDFDITGLLIKGDDPAIGPALLFGFLGNGKLFLQIRNLDISNEIIKCTEPLAVLPAYLKLIRNGNMFEAMTSADGQRWEHFEEVEFDLRLINSVGLVVSSEDPKSLVSARFSDIHLSPLIDPGTVQTNTVPVQ